MRYGGGWHALTGFDNTLDASAVRHGTVVLTPPHDWDGATPEKTQWVLWEGFCNLGSIRTQSLGSAIRGWGGRLTMVAARYNRTLASPLRLAARTIDTGILRYCKADDNGRWLLVLRDSIQQRESWQVWRWERGAYAPVPALPSEYVWQSDHVQMLGPDPAVWAWGVSCEGMWQGTRFVDRLPETDLSALIGTAEDWTSLAQWLRWWRVPLLSEPYVVNVRLQVDKQPLETLRAWISSSSPTGTSWDSPSSWIEVLRNYFHDWSPDPEVANRALEEFEFLKGPTPETWWQGHEALLAISPVLMVNLANAGLRGRGCSPQDRRAALSMLAARIAGLSSPGSAGLAKAEQSCLEDAASQWGLDHVFLEREVFSEAAKRVGLFSEGSARHQWLRGSTARGTSDDNLRIALNVGPLREWLAMRLIRGLTENEGK